MKPTTAILATISTSLCLASSQIVTGNYVPYGNGSAPSPRFLEASRYANVSNQVTFNHGSSMTSGQNWTWTLKMVDVHAPNLTAFDIPSQSTVNVSNPSVAFTTYNFAWPGGGSLDQAVQRGVNQASAFTEDDPSCLYFLYIQFPGNVSEKWRDDGTSECTSALGEECVDAITSGISGSGCRSGNFPSQGRIRESCAGSFGANEGGGWAVNAYPFGNYTAPANSTSIQSGETFSWVVSVPYETGNSTAFQEEEEKLRIVALTGGGSRQLLCNRVAKSAGVRASTGVTAAVSAIAILAAVMGSL